MKIKELNEKTIPELEKTRKKIYNLAWAMLIIGVICQAGAWVVYFSTFIIGLSVMLFIYGMSSTIIYYLLLHETDTISTMIFLRDVTK